VPVDEAAERPEHNEVRLPLVERLLGLGWSPKQVQWNPEWRVPRNPSEHSRREAGQHFLGFPVDVIVWESEALREDPEAALIIFETKKPTATEGRRQLENYLSLEYTAKMGYWTNGAESLAIYRLPSGKFSYQVGAPLPKPTDTFSIVGETPLRYHDLEEPQPLLLRAKLDRVFGVVVARDTVSTRSDQRLNQLCNLLLTKLASDQAAKRSPGDNLVFQPMESERETGSRIRKAFGRLKAAYPTTFSSNDDTDLRFDDHTLHEVVYELASTKLVDVTPETISEAFQVFRSANLKSGEGQYFTPSRIIRSAVEIMEIGYEDRIIDPACGTGGFLVESYLSLSRQNVGLSEADRQKWAQHHLFGVDRDDINVKLARAIMQIIGDGSSNIEIGDSLREHMWSTDYPHLGKTLQDASFTCVITNPPFGRDLRLSAKDGRLSDYTITKKGKTDHQELEVGLVFMERCYRLLADGGRLGIILPETYWFSSTYAWLRDWLEGRFLLRGMFNVPMEAFQSFCRAKTNFYVLEKLPTKGGSKDLAPPRPSWYRADRVVVSSAPKCGINKDGIDRVIVGPNQIGIGDDLYADVLALRNGKTTTTTRFVPIADVLGPWRAVPTHFDQTSVKAFRTARAERWPDWSEMTLGELIDKGWIARRYGHGSPSKDQRDGVIPYIKVSDLRAGLVNVNTTNMVSNELAEALWNGKDSGLKAFDLLSPERASSNIGEFCVLMPGQEQVVLTREVIVLRVAAAAPFDAFYLLWALSLQVVRAQWRRVIFMQTNREDVGDRYREVIVPVPPNRAEATAVSKDFRAYFSGLSRLRATFAKSLSADKLHHFTLTGGDAVESERADLPRAAEPPESYGSNRDTT
jgi:type I restriction enzyme M protein